MKRTRHAPATEAKDKSADRDKELAGRRKRHETDGETFAEMIRLALRYKDTRMLTALYKFQQRTVPEYSDEEREEPWREADNCHDLTKVCMGSIVYQEGANCGDAEREKISLDWIIDNGIRGDDYDLNAITAAWEDD